MILLLVSWALAVEGMWEPSQLRGLAAELRAAGYTDDVAALADVNRAPLGAVVVMGGCTASFVSELGLLVTNHHCAIGALQRAQREGEDLVASGFYAPSRAEERTTGQVTRVQVLEGNEDVTATVQRALDAARDDRARSDAYDEVTRKLVGACERAPGRRCRVVSFFEGRRYTLVRHLELRDVRVVMVPPDMVGNYGDEVDNWHWPRHSGDFAFLRAYVGPDGQPADPAVENVPYAPAHRLRWQPRGVSPGEFVMLAGYPGHTERWRTAAEVRQEAEVRLPVYNHHAEWVYALLTRQMQSSPEASARLSVSRSSIGNALFNNRGTLVGFRLAGVPEATAARDAAVDRWVAADPERAARLGPAIAELRASIAAADASLRRDAAMDWLGRGDLLSAARRLYRWALERQKPEPRREPGYQERDRERTLAGLVDQQAGLHLPTEREHFAHFLAEVLALPAAERPAELMAWLQTQAPGEGAPAEVAARVADRVFATPALGTAAAREAWFGKSVAEFRAADDGLLSLAVALRPYDEAREEREKRERGLALRTRPRFAEALAAVEPQRAYADANRTLRVSFGTVQGYEPRDGLTATPQTRVEGIVEKAGPWPFAAPPALLSAIQARAWGPYADPRLGSVPVDFLSDLDITGGNSGSAILDARGRIVGLAFDTVYEGIASDWQFDPARSRSVGVDSRYVLWYLDAVAGADALLSEMGATPAI